jgi:hypothetical protein
LALLLPTIDRNSTEGLKPESPSINIDRSRLSSEEERMSTGDVAAFMRRMAVDAQLRNEMTEVASTRGFVFTPDELARVDFEAACGRLLEPQKPREEISDLMETDPGFGIIEIPA